MTKNLTSLKISRGLNLRLIVLVLMSLILLPHITSAKHAEKETKAKDAKKPAEKKDSKAKKGEPKDKKKDDKKDAKKDEKKGETTPKVECNKDLMQSFRLDGLEKDEVSSNMEACKSVTAANNCCSKVDEIKIIKSWNAFSVPKLNKFADDMIVNYKRVYSFDSFIRELDAKKGRYHYSEYKWHKTAEEKCFDGKYFVSQTGIGKLHAKLDWNNMMAEKAANFILNHVIEALDDEGLLDRPLIASLVQKPMKKNKEILNALLFARPGFAMRGSCLTVENTYIAHIVAATGTKLNQGEKKKEETLVGFLNRKLTIHKTLKEYMDKSYKNKNVRELQDYTTELHLKGIMKGVKQFLQSSKKQPTSVVKSVEEHLKESGELKKRLGFFVLHDSMKNKGVLKAIFNLVIKSIVDVVLKHKDIKGNNYESMLEIVKSIKETLLIDKFMEETFSKNLFPFLGQEMISKAFLTLHKKKKAKYDDLMEIYKVVNWKTYRESKIPGKPNLTTDKHHFVIPHILIAAVNKSKSSVKFDAKKILDHAYNGAVEELKSAVKTIKLPVEQKSVVCAIVYHSNLFREVRFNQDKLDYCLGAEADFKAHKVSVKDTVELIETLRPELRSILELKRGFYCGICDKKMSSFINTKSNKISLDKEFCYDTVKKFKKYLEWKNVDFLEYILKAYQFLKCFSDDGSPQKMPFKFMDPKHEKHLPMMKSCMTIKNKKEVGSCIPICDTFDYVHYSPVFDGEKKFIHKMINFILNVVRTHGFQYKRILQAVPETDNIPERKLSSRRSRSMYDQESSNFEHMFTDDSPSERFLKDTKKDTAKPKEPKEAKKKAKEDPKKKKDDGKGDLKKAGKTKKTEKDVPKPKSYPTIYDLFKGLGKMTDYTRAKYYEFNEVKHSHRTYNVTKKNINFKQFVYEVKDTGMNPVAIFKASNFDPAVANLLVGHSNDSHENLDKNVVRAIIGIQDEDVNFFNTEFTTNLGEAVPPNPERENKKAHEAKIEADKEKKAKAQQPKLPIKKALDKDGNPIEEPAADGKPADGKPADGKPADDAKAPVEGKAVVTEGAPAGGEKPRQLYGKLYKKLYKKSKYSNDLELAAETKEKKRKSSPMMKAIIELLF